MDITWIAGGVVLVGGIIWLFNSCVRLRNRAREALRVMEDVARFAVDDPGLVTELKRLRHELTQTLAGLPEGWLEVNRDVAGDVGTTVAADGEYERAGLVAVATAAGKRLGEALRVIEETAKTLDSALSERVETLRYRAYDAERTLLVRLSGGHARQDFEDVVPES